MNCDLRTAKEVVLRFQYRSRESISGWNDERTKEWALQYVYMCVRAHIYVARAYESARERV